MKQFKNIIILSLFSLLFGCNNSSNSSSVNLTEISKVAEQEEGLKDVFQDVFLKIVSEEKIKDSYIFIAKGLSKSKVVGLKFEIKSNLPNGINTDGSLDAKNGFIRNAIKISSIGKESDELLKAISKLYGFPTDKKFTINTLSPTAFSLNKSIVDFEKLGYYKFKLFFGDSEKDEEEDYCELYFNINNNEKTIELFEKDSEYRKSLINVFKE
ncbi:hypothetical protein AR687_24395 [Flavobacteriaceae bacterium CRH]|nr:hypothetical protein AR687_24395 [Flavobacteriaceae bacterium CRH]